MKTRQILVLAGALIAATTLGAAARERSAPEIVVERYASGHVRRISEYRDGKLDGVVRGWYESGAPMLRYHYRNGESEGLQQVWYPSGQIFTSFHHLAGHEIGQQQMWNADGSIRSNYVIRDGRRYGLLGAMGCTGKRDSSSVTSE